MWPIGMVNIPKVNKDFEPFQRRLIVMKKLRTFRGFFCMQMKTINLYSKGRAFDIQVLRGYVKAQEKRSIRGYLSSERCPWFGKCGDNVFSEVLWAPQWLIYGDVIIRVFSVNFQNSLFGAASR